MRRLIAAVAVVFLVLLATVLIVWGAVLVFANRQGGGTTAPGVLASQVKRESVDASLALRALAGVPDRDVVSAALAAGKLETAFAAVAFGESLTDLERAGGLLALGQEYLGAKDSQRAGLCFQVLVSLAVLSGDFHDYQKANLLIQAGDGLVAAGRSEDAAEAYDRASELAGYSPSLQASQRPILLQTLAAKFAALNRPDDAQEAVSAVSRPATPKSAPPVVVSLPAKSISWRDDPSWARVSELEAQRGRAVNGLIASLGSASPEAQAAQRAAVEAALLAEDEARERFFVEQGAKAGSASARLALAHARVEWTNLKWRVAARGFGASLVPAWEAKVKEIESSLRRRLQDDYTLRLEMAAALPDPLEARQLTVDLLVEEIKLCRLGLYPSSPEKGLASDLTDAIEQRIALRRDDTLYAVPVTRNGAAGLGFAFANADQLLRQ